MLVSKLPKIAVRSAVILLAVLAAFEPFHFGAAAAPSWSSPILVDSQRGLDILPSALQASNGTMWLAWESDRNDLSNARFDIIYKTYTNGVWSNDYNLTTSGKNASPSLVQLVNGTILAFWVMKPARSYEVFYKRLIGSTWSTPVQVTTTTLNDTLNAAAVNNRDGSLWLVWTRVDSSCACAASKQLYYKTLKNGVWSSDVQLTNDNNQNYGASVLIAKDGIVRVVWSKGAAGSNYQLFYEAYNSTSGSWSSSFQVVSSSSTDEHPSLIQDRNGTLWLFWSRLIVVSLLIQYYVLFGKYSYDLGKTWSGEIQLTNTSNTVDSQMPSAVQSTYGVKPLWVFFSSNLNVPDNDIYALMSSGIGPVHDVTMSGVSAANNLGTSWEYPGGLKSVGLSAIVTVRVAISNIGDVVENVIATLSYTNNTTVPVGTVKSLVGPGNTMNFYFYWNTTNVKVARYGFSVSIAALPGETSGNMGDNSYSVANQVLILPFGDVDQDGDVSIIDLSIFFHDYNSAVGSPLYNPYCDIAGTGIINIVDIGVVLYNFNTRI
jgi:hypothetical protein